MSNNLDTCFVISHLTLHYSDNMKERVKKMSKKNQKVNVTNSCKVSEVTAVSNVDDSMYYRNALNNADMFNNVIDDKQAVINKVLTVNQEKATRIDYMSMSRVAFFRIAVKQFMLFNELARIDYNFYNKTNDRSRTQKQAKHDDLLKYSRMRTYKQLNDVVKESFAQKIFKQHNLDITSAKQYELQINKMMINRNK